MEVFEEREGVREMKGGEKRRVESRRREMKKDRKKGVLEVDEEMEWSEARKREC